MTTSYDEDVNAARSGLARLKQMWPVGPWNPTRDDAYLRAMSKHSRDAIHSGLDRIEMEHDGRFPPTPAQVRGQLPSRRESGPTAQPTFIPVGPAEDNAWIVVQPDGRRISADTYNQRGGSRPDAMEGEPLRPSEDGEPQPERAREILAMLKGGMRMEPEEEKVDSFAEWLEELAALPQADERPPGGAGAS